MCHRSNNHDSIFDILYEEQTICVTDTTLELIIMTEIRDADKLDLMNMDKEKLIDFLLLHIRNLWAVDGLYYLGIEKKFGTKEATHVDSEVWKAMASIEARRLKKIFNLKQGGIEGVIKALSLTSWALDLENKEITKRDKESIFTNHVCRVQNTRISKGFDVFPCKSVRFGYLEQFAKEIDAEVKVECIACPPDKLPEGVWCSWKFTKSTSH